MNEDTAGVNLLWLAEVCWGITIIPLPPKDGQAQGALIDTASYPLVGGDKWHISAQGYVVRNIKKKTGTTETLMHRVIIKAPKGVEVDHWNRYRQDNRRRNIRIATRTQNNANHPRHKQNRTAYKGVRVTAEGRYNARIAGKHIGNFDTLDAAAQAYNDKAISLYGPFARLNETGGEFHG